MAGRTAAEPQPDLMQARARPEWLEDATRGLLAPANRPVRGQERRATKTESQKLQALLIAAQAAEARFQTLIEAAFDALPERICVLDETGTIVAVNKAWRALAAANGADRRCIGEGANYLAACDEATGEHADEARALAGGLRAVMRGERRECEVEYPCQSTAAQEWYLCRATRLCESGRARFVVVHEDITDRKRAELALRAANEAAEATRQKEATRRHEAEQRRHIAESLRDVMSLLNSERPLGDVLEHISSRANRLLRSQAAAVYRSGFEAEAALTEVRHGSAASMMTGKYLVIDPKVLRQTVLQQGAFAISDVPGALADVAEQMPSTAASPAFKIPIVIGCSALLAAPILIGDEVYGGLVLYYAAPRRFTPKEVELANKLADQVALAIENIRRKQQAAEAAATQERNRLARDLHDAVTQAIFSANLIADALPRVWEHDPDEGQRGLQQLHLLTQGALAEMRTLLFELRPAALVDKSLPDLLRQLTQAMATRSAASVTFEAEGTCVLPPPVHVAVYRIAQEALNNAAKHAAARTVRVVLRCSPQRLVLRIHDDGRGFEASEVTADHFGIAIMQERARPIGATCSIRSQPGRGTQVTVVWPAAATANLNHPHSAAADLLGAREPLQKHNSPAQQAYVQA
jgi:signal transduction histidine kinase/PAS domain-containing protein